MIKKIAFILFLLIPLYNFSQDLTIVRNSAGKYGFIDKSKDTLIDCKYDYAENFSSGLALVKNNLRFKLIDTSGKLYNLSEFNENQKFRYEFGENFSGLPVLVKQWDCEYINSSGETFLAIPYQDAGSFEAGKAIVFDGDKYNYISKNGIILNSWIAQADDYHAMKYNDKYGFIDKNGKLVIEYTFINAKDFHDGFAQISNGTYWALINKKGERISDWFEEIESFEGNIAIVKKLGNIGFINKTGKFMGEWYKSIKALDYGMYKVEKYEKFALINNDGYVVTQWFDNIFDFKDGYIKVEKEGKYAYINKIGALVVGWYDNLGTIENGIIFVDDAGKRGFFNVETFIISSFYDYIGDFIEGLAIVKQNNKYTYINKNGELLTAFQFDVAKNFNSGIAEVVKSNKTAYINDKAEVVLGWFDSKKYYQTVPPKGIIAVKFGRKYGFQTINGRRIIPAIYDYAENFSEGVALVKVNPTVMYIDKTGKLIAKDDVKSNTDLRIDQGYAHLNEAIQITKWECSFIDENGDVAIKLNNYDNAESFFDEKAKVYEGDKYNYINKKGKLLGDWIELPDDYHAIENNGKFGYINKNGIIAIDYKYNYAYDFENGIAKVRIGDRQTGKFALIKLNGDLKTKMYDQISPFNDYNISIVKNLNKYALIDTSGKEISQWYDKIYDFSENFAKVKLNNLYSFINIKGLQVNKWFDDAGEFSNGRAKVKLKDKWGYVNYKIEIAVAAIYDEVWNFKNNIAKVQKDDKFAFIDLNGKLITDWFDRLYMFSDERAVVSKDNKWGYVDFNGKIVIPLIYQRAFAFSKGEALVVKDGIMIKIDKNGNQITKVQN